MALTGTDITAALATPIAVADPDVAYDTAMFRVAMDQQVRGKQIVACMTIQVRPFRVLKDGTIEEAPPLTYAFESADAIGQAEQDAFLAVVKAASDHMTAKAR